MAASNQGSGALADGRQHLGTGATFQTLTSINLNSSPVDDQLPILQDQSSNDLESLLFEPRPDRSGNGKGQSSGSHRSTPFKHFMPSDDRHAVQVGAVATDSPSPGGDCCAAFLANHARTPVRTHGAPSPSGATSGSGAAASSKVTTRSSSLSHIGTSTSYVRWSGDDDDADAADADADRKAYAGWASCWECLKTALCSPCLLCLCCMTECRRHGCCCDGCDVDEDDCMWVSAVSPSSRALRSRSSQAAILQQMELESRETVLTKACHEGNGQRICELLQREDPNKPNRSGDTPLIIASSNGRADLVRQLLEGGADPNGRDVQGYTVLMRAAESGSVDVTMDLLEAGADATARVGDGATALYMAARAGRKRIVDELLKHLVEQRHFAFMDAVLRSSLRKARRMGLEDLSLALVRAGANLNGQDRAGMTPLMLASQQGLCEVVEEMLGLGASAAMVSRYDGDTALTLACSHAHHFKRYYERTVRLLLGAGADVRHRTADFRLTPLAYAVHASNDAVVARLLAAGAEPDHMDGEGLTPLVRALGSTDQSQHVSSRARLAAALLAGGADPNMADGHGRTPLRAVVERSHAVAESQLLVMLLLQAGAERHKPDVGGRSAVDADSPMSAHHQLLRSHMPSLKLRAAAAVRRCLRCPLAASVAELRLRSGQESLRLFLTEGFLEGLEEALEAAELAAQNTTDRSSALFGDTALEII